MVTNLAALIDAFLAEAMPPEEARKRLQRVAVRDFPAGRSLLGLDRPLRAEAAAIVLERLLAASRASSGTFAFTNRRTLLQALALRLVNGSAPLEEHEAIRLAEAAGGLTGYLFWDAPAAALVRVFEEHIAAHGLSARLREALAQIRPTPFGPSMTALCDQLQALGHGEVRQKPASVEILPGDAWANALLGELAGAPEGGAAWQELLRHCESATASSPSERWLSRAGDLVRAKGMDDFAGKAALALSRIGLPGTRPIPRSTAVAGTLADATLLDPEQTDLLRGLVWATATVADPRLIPALGDAALACFQKIPNLGSRNVKIGNACLFVLGRSADPSTVVQLSRLLLKFKAGSIRKQIERTLHEVARRTGLTPAELQEISVPRLGLSGMGVRREALGDFTAEILVAGTNESELRWLRSDGKVQKAVPATVRSEHPKELAALRKVQKEILSLLANQRDRIDQLYVSSASWDLTTWRERYLDHPLVGVVARRLVWRFGEGSEARLGVAPEGQLFDAHDEPLGDMPAGTRVALWHPLDSPPEEVLAWRRWFEERQIRQPFKQAHREIYVLTDAERETETYSNRFAAHILRQHAFAALCAQRGWSYHLQGAWDSYNLPCRVLPGHDLRLELQIQPAQEDERSETSVFLYVTSGQMRFSTLAGELRSLETIPPRVFSELLRDVDLFVSVTSIGNDPAWEGHDWGLPAWEHDSFGELNATARTRREILERLLPRLKIAGRCSLTDRFLVVRGDVRTYKIHLGSGNVLMEPNHQYLCIVSGKTSAAGFFLPFEGDRTFSIILSKALLLAEDRKITDRVILRQIGPG